MRCGVCCPTPCMLDDGHVGDHHCECLGPCAICGPARAQRNGYPAPRVESDGWRSYGNVSASDAQYGVGLRCVLCRVRWLGCVAAADCPECGAEQDYHQEAW